MTIRSSPCGPRSASPSYPRRAVPRRIRGGNLFLFDEPGRAAPVIRAFLDADALRSRRTAYQADCSSKTSKMPLTSIAMTSFSAIRPSPCGSPISPRTDARSSVSTSYNAR